MSWDRKTDWPIGYAPPEERPKLFYQCLLGMVFTRLVWPDGSASRGQTDLAELEKITGSTPREGWYDQSGKYLGAHPPDSLVSD